MSGQSDSPYPAAYICWEMLSVGLHVDIHPFSFVEQIFAGHTYFFFVAASSGQVYWSTEILYVNSAFSWSAFTILKKCRRWFLYSFN